MLILSFNWLLHSLLILLTVAFFTLFERNVIGLVHLRLGPNNVSFIGLLQPLFDAFNLLSNQGLISQSASKLVYSSSPVASLFFSIMFWVLLPTYFFLHSNTYSLLSFLLIGSIMVFANLLSGWSSNSKYTFIGSLRSVAQSVSYESVFTTLGIILLSLTYSYSFLSINTALTVIALFLLPFWIFSTLAETHRAPFDFSESESELVSGYNTEYSGGYFAFVFLSEYSSLLFSCSIIYFIFICPSSYLNFPILYSFFTILVSIFFILVRVTYCRFRYDYLIYLAWKTLLPSVLFILVLVYIFVSCRS